MAIFGYLGDFGGPTGLDALCAYGDRVAAKRGESSCLSHCARDATHGCWGPTLANDGPVTVVLDGRPALARTHQGDAGQAFQPAAAILADYRRNGIAVLRALTGPFALAIVDGSVRRVLIAIDRMGIERLAYAVRPNGIVFSTSVIDVAAAPNVDASLDHQGLFNYLLHHMVPAPGTSFLGVQKLQAACYALYENGTVRVERYWAPQFERGNRASFKTLKNQLHRSLRDAVRSQSDASKSIGAFLSGGLDSSTVAGMLSVTRGAAAQTFSIGFGYPQYDELPYARIVNAHFGCDGTEYVIRGSDIVDSFPLIARAYDEPFGNSSALPTYYCARLARDHGVHHLLAGDGGDELFAGNSRYADQRIFELYRRVPQFLRHGILEPFVSRPHARLSPLSRRIRSYIEQSNTPLPERLERWNLLRRLRIDEILCPDFLAAIDPEAPFIQMRDLWNSTPSGAYLHRMLYYDWQYTLADNDLRKVGAMCALAGIRVSYPMLDVGVVDLSTGVPPRMMMPRRRLRDFYKRAMRGFLPDAVIHKKKHGFGLPFGLWLRESPPLRALIFDNLSDLRKRRMIRPEFLERLLHLHDREDASYYGVFVWVAAMLEQWLREHGVAA